MARPERQDIGSSLESWDEPTDQNFQNLMEIVTTLGNGQEGSLYTDVGDLPNASSYEGCLAAVDAGTWEIYFSDGTSWVRVGTTADDSDIGAITDNSGGTAGGTQGARVIAEVTNLATAQDAITTLAAWCNELRGAMVASGLIT